MIGRNLPINTEAIIKDGDTSIGFRMIEVITLVLEDGGLGEDGEAVGKTLRNEELTMIVLCQLYRYMLAISRGTFTNFRIPPFNGLYPPSFPPFAGDRNPLTKGSSTFLTKPLFNSLYDPFGSPCRGQKPQEREDVTAPPVLGTATL